MELYDLKDNKSIKDYYSKLFNPKVHLENIDFPKGAGTSGEIKASEYVSSTLTNYGYDPKLEEFYFEQKNFSLTSLLPFLIFFVWSVLLMANIEWFSFNFFLSVLILLFPLVFILIFIFFGTFNKYLIEKSRKKLYKFNKKVTETKIKHDNMDNPKKSRNIIASIGPEDANEHILFTAHIDSISSAISIKVMEIVGIIVVGGFLLLNLAYLVNLATMDYFQINFMKQFSLIIILIIVIIFLFALVLQLSRFFRGNNSHGIIDNGTGVSVLLEIAHFLKEKNFNKAHVTFGFYGAEELGLYGSAYHYSTKNYNKDKLHVISVDMIGEKGPVSYIKSIFPLRKKYFNKYFNEKIESIAKDLEIPVKGSKFFYSGSDFAHWFFDGYKSNWLINPSSFIHSKNDNLENVDFNLVQDTVILFIEYLKNEYKIS